MLHVFLKAQVFTKTCYLRKYAVVGCKVYGDFWVHVYAFWVHVYAFWVHVYGSVGCMSMDRLGACMRLLGAKSAATFGCMSDSR